MAISADMTFWINTLIFNKLADICPTLSLIGEDRRVYDICKIDFKNYIEYLERNHLKIDDISNDSVPQDVVLTEIISIMIGDTGEPIQNLEGTKEITEFVDMWVHWWWRKWIQRTKVILNDTDTPPQALELKKVTGVFTPEEEADFMIVLTDKHLSDVETNVVKVKKKILVISNLMCIGHRVAVRCVGGINRSNCLAIAAMCYMDPQGDDIDQNWNFHSNWAKCKVHRLHYTPQLERTCKKALQELMRDFNGFKG